MITFYTPRPEDLWFREQMLSDEQTMAYNHAWGGTIPFPEEKWAAWYTRWMLPDDGKRFYRYIVHNRTFVGEAAWHFDQDRQIYLADVIVYAPYRGKGYGRQALLLLCETAKANGIQMLYDEIAIDNPAIELFMKCGFQEVSRTDEAILVKKRL